MIGATGVFTQPKPPDIPGVETLRRRDDAHRPLGPLGRSARASASAVIGTGASAVQVIPAIAPEVEQLTVFQRTPIWCLPKLDAPIGARARARPALGPRRDARRALAQPGVRRADVRARRALRGHVPVPAGARRSRSAQAARRRSRIPEVREKLTPHYRLGCKRPSFSNEYLRTFNRDNVQLETVADRGDHAERGAHRRRRSSTRSTCWCSPPASRSSTRATCRRSRCAASAASTSRSGGTPTASRPTRASACPGFPNWFSILGPYGFNGQSYFGLIETQMRHIVRCLERARARARDARRDHAGGQPPLLRIGARAPAATRSSSAAPARTPTATTSTSTATCRSGPA